MLLGSRIQTIIYLLLGWSRSTLHPPLVSVCGKLWDPSHQPIGNANFLYHCFADIAMSVESIRRELWLGEIPTCFTLDTEDLASIVNEPEPCCLMLPR